MKTITLKFPDTLDIDAKEITMLIASILYKNGKLSLGQAAALAGISKRAFAELLSHYGVSIFNFPASDISKDVRNA